MDLIMILLNDTPRDFIGNATLGHPPCVYCEEQQYEKHTRHTMQGETTRNLISYYKGDVKWKKPMRRSDYTPEPSEPPNMNAGRTSWLTRHKQHLRFVLSKPKCKTDEFGNHGEGPRVFLYYNYQNPNSFWSALNTPKEEKHDRWTW